MQIPTIIPYLAAFCGSLFFCVIFHLFVRSRSHLKSKTPGSTQNFEMDPGNCNELIRNQIMLIQTCSHPSPQGRKNTERLAEFLLEARIYFPSAKSNLDAFAGRLREVYEDEGLLLMALMDLRKWLNTNLDQPDVS